MKTNKDIQEGAGGGQMRKQQLCDKSQKILQRYGDCQTKS